MDSFDKGWFVLQTYSGYENKVKENLLQRAQTYNMLDNILRVEIPTQTVQVEKNGKKKNIYFRGNIINKSLEHYWCVCVCVLLLFLFLFFFWNRIFLFHTQKK